MLAHDDEIGVDLVCSRHDLDIGAVAWPHYHRDADAVMRRLGHDGFEVCPGILGGLLNKLRRAFRIPD